MRAGRPPRFTLAELAFAQDLHDQGAPWKIVERFCGAGIHQAIRNYART